MAATDHFTSIDSLLADMRVAHASEMQTLKDELIKAQLEAAMHKAACEKAVEARSAADRTVTKLLTQFGTVALVFEEARAVAIEAGLSTEPKSAVVEAIIPAGEST